MTTKQLRRLEGERVRMQFDDGREVVAVLLCATRDMDGSEHLVYEMVDRAAEAQTCCYANAKSLVSIEEAADLVA